MSMAMIPPLLIALALGYLLGSIPFGLLLTRAAGLGDVREIGSKSIGATNVLRTGNKKIAALTLLFDLLKGTAAVLLGMIVAAKLASATIGEITRHLWVMMAATFSVVLLITYVPILTSWLPKLLASMR